MVPLGFTEVKRAVVSALIAGDYLIEARGDIDVKNLLATGDVSASALAAVLKRCSGSHHTSSPHHRAPSIVVHMIRSGGWYVKFYFVDPTTIFISVHQ